MICPSFLAPSSEIQQSSPRFLLPCFLPVNQVRGASDPPPPPPFGTTTMFASSEEVASSDKAVCHRPGISHRIAAHRMLKGLQACEPALYLNTGTHIRSKAA